MDHVTFLARTGQRWKLLVGFVVAPVLGAALILNGRGLVEQEIVSSATLPMLVGSALSMGGLWLAAWGIRCPACGTRVFWRAMHEPGNPGLRLLVSEECSACGDDGRPPATSALRQEAMRPGTSGLLAAALAFGSADMGLAAAPGVHEPGRSKEWMQVDGEVVSVTFCAVTKDEPFPAAQIRARLDVTNGSVQAAIVARRSGMVRTVRAARSRGDLDRRAFLSELSWSEVYTDQEAKALPKLAGTPSPHPAEFAVLAPGESLELGVDLTLPVARPDAPPTPPILDGDETYWLEIDIPLWPFALASEREVVEAATLWRRVGRPERGIATAVLPVHLPPVLDVQTCGASAR